MPTEVQRYSDNPVISESYRAWAAVHVEQDGHHYVLSSRGDTNVTELYTGETLTDLTRYSNNPVYNWQIMGVAAVDGRFHALAFDRNGGSERQVRHATAEDFVDWTDRGVVLEHTDVPSASEGGLLHPYLKHLDGEFHSYFVSIVESGNQDAEMATADYPDLDGVEAHGTIIDAQASWESTAVTNPTPRLTDGQWLCYYSAGPGGDDRNIGVRWGASPDEWDGDVRDQPIVESDGGAFEGGYVNVGDVSDGMLLYFGFGSEDTGLVEHEYGDLTTFAAPDSVPARVHDGSSFVAPSSVPSVYDGSQFAESPWRLYRWGQWVDVDWGAVSTAAVVADFEDGNVDEWTLDSLVDGSVSAQQSTVLEGSWSVEIDGDRAITSLPGDGLAAYPNPGDTVRARIQRDVWGPEVTDHSRIGWATQSHGWTPNGYNVILSDLDGFRLQTDAGGTAAQDSSFSPTAGETYEVEAAWASDGSMTAELFVDDTGDGTFGTTVAGPINMSDAGYSDGGVYLQSNHSTDNASLTVYDYYRLV